MTVPQKKKNFNLTYIQQIAMPRNIDSEHECCKYFWRPDRESFPLAICRTRNSMNEWYQKRGKIDNWLLRHAWRSQPPKTHIWAVCGWTILLQQQKSIHLLLLEILRVYRSTWIMKCMRICNWIMIRLWIYIPSLGLPGRERKKKPCYSFVHFKCNDCQIILDARPS